LPHLGGKPALTQAFSDARRKVLTAAIPGRRVALVAYSGWDDLSARVHSGRNAETDESTVVYAHKKRLAKNPAMELMICVLLHRLDDGTWTDEELDPVKSIEIMDITPSYSALGVRLQLRDGRNLMIDFANIDGERKC
jgi:hypothetical protein